jgi:hypothetical protein
MDEHLSEAILERYVLEGLRLNALQRQAIERHLQQCSLCREQHGLLEKMYASIKVGLEDAPAQQDIKCAERLFFPKRRSVFSKMLPEPREDDAVFPKLLPVLQPVWAPVINRLTRYAQIHPLRFASINFAAVSLLALLFIISRPAPPQPAYARAQNEFLVVYDKDGNELWKKCIGREFDRETYLKKDAAIDLNDMIKVYDTDDDGKNEVISAMGLNDSINEHNKLICFGNDQKEKWSFVFTRPMTFGEESISDEYNLYNLLIGDFDRNGQAEILVIARHRSLYPSAIVKLNAGDGGYISEYWHSGALSVIKNYDLDGDGVEEILAAGQNNSYDLAALVILDARRIEGHSPATESYTPRMIPAGREKYYITFPRSDLRIISEHERNITRHIEFRSNRLIEVGIHERIAIGWAVLMYRFDYDMKLISVDAEDAFIATHRQLETQGRLHRSVDAKYLEELRQGVRYWDGEKFVEEAVRNKNYLATGNRLP